MSHSFIVILCIHYWQWTADSSSTFLHFHLTFHHDWIQQPNAPKRALSAYMIFSNEQRVSWQLFRSRVRDEANAERPLLPNAPQQTVKEENPDATFGEMGKLLGARWKEMDENAKKVGFFPFWNSGAGFVMMESWLSFSYFLPLFPSPTALRR